MEIKFTQQALDELENIYQYITQNNGVIAAKQVLFKIEKTVDCIGDFPEIGIASAVNNTREMSVAKLPFLIIYQTQNKVIFVLTIFHTSQDLSKKFNFLK